MAAVTLADSVADTGGTPNVSGAFVPVTNDLIVVLVSASTTAQAVALLTNSVGLAFTQFAKGAYSASAHSLYGFVANALVSNTASQTITFDTDTDAAQGTVICTFRISGITRTGLSAVKQFKTQDNQTTGTPAPVFNTACLTGNPTLFCLGSNTNPAALTEPSGWTESVDTGYATPTQGTHAGFRNSGFTGTTVTWGSAPASNWGAMIVEIDTSAAATGAPLLMQHHNS